MDKSNLWTFDLSNFSNEFDLSNENLTIKCKSINDLATTILGTKPLSIGVHQWNICIDQLIGPYICIGIIPYNQSFNPKANNYMAACCVCSDKYIYNLQKVNGDISNGIFQGDMLEFILDFDNEVFTVKNGAQFEYQWKNIKNRQFYPYFEFSSCNSTQLSLFF